MPGHRIAALERFGHFAVRVIGAGEDAREVHHLAKADNAVPRHGFGDVVGADRRTGVLEPGDGGHARRRGYHRFEGNAARILFHDLHAVEAEYVADLVRIHVNAGRTVSHGGPRVLGHAEHRGLHVDVAVEEAGGDVSAAGFDYRRLVADAVIGTRPHVRDAPPGDGHIDAFLDFGCAYVDELGTLDNRIRRLQPLRNRNKRRRDFPQLMFAEPIDHGSLFRSKPFGIRYPERYASKADSSMRRGERPSSRQNANAAERIRPPRHIRRASAAFRRPGKRGYTRLRSAAYSRLEPRAPPNVSTAQSTGSHMRSGTKY